MVRPACASGIQPAGSIARTRSAMIARWRAARKNPVMGGFSRRALAESTSGLSRLDGNAAVQDEILAGGKSGIVAGQPEHNARHLLRGADPAHGLARGEGLAGGFVIARVPETLLQRGRIHRAWTERI